MSLHYYQSHVTRYLQASRLSLKNPHKCPVIVSIHIQAAPAALSTRTLLGTSVLLLALTGAKPTLLIKTSRRTKESFVSGTKIKVRGKEALDFLVSLRSTAFYYSFNFRGFLVNSPNPTQSLTLKHLSYLRSLNRAFDTGILGFEDDGLSAFLQISHSNGEGCSTLLRAARLPMRLDD